MFVHGKQIQADVIARVVAIQEPGYECSTRSTQRWRQYIAPGLILHMAKVVPTLFSCFHVAWTTVTGVYKGSTWLRIAIETVAKLLSRRTPSYGFELDIRMG